MAKRTPPSSFIERDQLRSALFVRTGTNSGRIHAVAASPIARRTVNGSVRPRETEGFEHYRDRFHVSTGYYA